MLDQSADFQISLLLAILLPPANSLLSQRVQLNNLRVLVHWLRQAQSVSGCLKYLCLPPAPKLSFAAEVAAELVRLVLVPE